MSVPSAIPVAELLPAMVSQLGRMSVSAASGGFRLASQSGRLLEQTLTLSEQGVDAGAILTLLPAEEDADNVRYDDLSEAIGHSLASSSKAWRPGDSVQLSAYSAAGLLLTAVALAAWGNLPPLVTAVACLAGALLVTLTSYVVGKTIEHPGGAMAIALTAPVMLAVSGVSASHLFGVGQVALCGGIGACVGAVAVVVLPQAARPCAVAPVILGAVAIGYDLLSLLPSVTPERAGALLVAVLTIVTLVAPWLGLASMPARIAGLSLSDIQPIAPPQLDRQVRHGIGLVLAIRIACGLATVALVPVTATSLPGGALMIVVGLALMLGTRTLHGRAEALVGLIAGMCVIVLCAIVTIMEYPGFLPWTICAAVVVAALVLVNNVISAKLRPQLSRLTDLLQILALIAIVPTTALVWGLV